MRRDNAVSSPVVYTIRMWVMVAGPYRSAHPDGRAANLRELNRAANELFRKGHVPIIGVNMALPMIDAAGPQSYDDIMMPLSLRLSGRCDAVLRIGGASDGADLEVEEFRRRGLPVFVSIEEIPAAGA